MKTPRTDYERIAATSSGQRLLRQEDLIFDTTEALAVALEKSGLNKTQLANRLEKTKAFVTQLLGGGRNLTLRTIADVSYALNCRPEIRLVPIVDQPVQAEPIFFSVAQQDSPYQNILTYSFSFLNQDAVFPSFFPIPDDEPVTAERSIAA